MHSVVGTAGVLGTGIGLPTSAATNHGQIHDSGNTLWSIWSWQTVAHTQALEDVFGQPIGTMMQFDHWNVRRLRGLQEGPGGYQDILDAGYVPHVVWNGPQAVDAADPTPWPEETPSASVYQEGGERHGQFCQDIVDGVLDEKLRAIAQELGNVNGPVLWNPWEEANGNWRPAIGTLNNGPSTWAAAWRHMYDIFQQEDTDNVYWILAPSGNVMRETGFGDVGSENGLDKWYPGDDYVDYIGTDFYDHGGSWNDQGSPAEILDDLLRQFDQVSSETKPYIQNEIGSVTGDARGTSSAYTAEEWTRQMLREIRDRDRVVYCLWWDSVNEDLGLTNAYWDTVPTVDSLTSVGEVVRTELEDPNFVGEVPATTQSTLVDDCSDFQTLFEPWTGGLTIDSSENAQIVRNDGSCTPDGSRIHATYDQTTAMTYDAGGPIQSFTVEAHVSQSSGGSLAFFASSDGGSTWTEVSPTESLYCDTGGDWQSYEYTATSLPDGASRLRIDVTPNGDVWTPQVGHVEVTYSDGSTDTVLQVPRDLSVGSKTETSVTFSWTDPNDAAIDHYNVYQGNTKTTESTTTEVTISELTAGTEYGFRVTAVDGDGNESARSPELVVTTAGGNSFAQDVAMVEDDCADLTTLHESSDAGSLIVDTANGNSFRRNDGSCSTDDNRITRSGTTGTVSLVYETGAPIQEFTVEGHTNTSAGGEITFHVSTDWGESWQEVSPTTTTYCADAHATDWENVEYSHSSLPEGATRLRIDLAGGDQVWAPQIGHVQAGNTRFEQETATVVDDCADTSLLHESSGSVDVDTTNPDQFRRNDDGFSPDDDRFKLNYQGNTGDLRYVTGAPIEQFTVEAHFEPGSGGGLTFYASTDGGESFQEVTAERTEYASSVDGSWNSYEYTGTSLPEGTGMLRIQMNEGDVKWTPQVGHVSVGSAQDDTVTGLELTGRTDTALTLAWDALDADAFAEYRLEADGGTAVTATEPTATLDGLAPGTQYTVSVTALDADGNALATSSSLTVATLPSSDEVTLAEAIDADGDGQIDDDEILEGIEYWRTNEPVPGTDGEQISDLGILDLIERWQGR